MKRADGKMERGILFKAPMVLAIIDNRKTMTRRVCDVQPFFVEDQGLWHAFYPWGDGGHGMYETKEEMMDEAWPLLLARCPYGKVGDILYVRETFSGPDWLMDVPPSEWGKNQRIWYWADGDPLAGDWTWPKPSIHMPRWVSRIDLEITGVRIEWLQDISEEDALAEGLHEELNCIIGCHCNGGYHQEITGDRYFYDGGNEEGYLDPVNAFSALWDSINAAPSPVKNNGKITSYLSYPWEDVRARREHRGKAWQGYGNPLVYVVEFKKVEKER